MKSDCSLPWEHGTSKQTTYSLLCALSTLHVRYGSSQPGVTIGKMFFCRKCLRLNRQLFPASHRSTLWESFTRWIILKLRGDSPPTPVPLHPCTPALSVALMPRYSHQFFLRKSSYCVHWHMGNKKKKKEKTIPLLFFFLGAYHWAEPSSQQACQTHTVKSLYLQ